MKNKNLAYLLISSSLLMAACSVKPSGGGKAQGPNPAAPSKKFFDKRATIQGPDVEGQWLSDCNYSSFEKSWRRFEMNFAGESVTRSEKIYSDDECTNLTETKAHNGIFRFIDSLTNDIFVVEYAFDLGGGITNYTMENLKKVDEMIYIGNFASGEGMGVIESEPLKKVDASAGDEKSEETTPPQETEARVVTSYQEATHLVCDLQGLITVVDFQGLNLSRNGSSNTKIGYRDCEGQVSWYEGEYPVSVTYQGSFPQLSFTTLGADRVQTWDTGSGLDLNSYARPAFGVIGGNSGECYFTKSTAVKGLLCN